MRSLKHVLFAVLVSAVAALTANQLGAFAYTSGATGYDISYPQCGAPYPSGQFGIVGVNGGYPFVYYNPCLGDEYAHTPSAALYVNTGYDPVYTQVDGKHTLPQCVTLSSAVSGSSAQRAAWAVGCSEAKRDISYATAQGAINPSGWWLDVETANSWSSTDLSLNLFSIQGLVDTLLRDAPGAVGIYSTSYQWTTIVGSGKVSGVVADWVATGSYSQKRAKPYCSRSFSGAPVRWVQYITGGFDADYACSTASQLNNRYSQALLQSLGNQRPVTGPGLTLDAQ